MLFMYNRSKKESHKTEFVFSCSSLTQSHWIKSDKWFPSVISFKVWYCCYCNFLLLADKEFCLTSVLKVVTSVDGTCYVILSFFKSSIRKKFRCSTKQNTSKIFYWLSKEIFPVFRVHRRLGFALPSLYFHNPTYFFLIHQIKISHFNWFKQGMWLTGIFLCPAADNL